MYKKFVKATIERAIENYFKVTVYGVEVKFNKQTEMVSFSAEGVKNDEGYYSVSYRGYMGILGQVVVTEMNGEQMSLENYLTIN